MSSEVEAALPRVAGRREFWPCGVALFWLGGSTHSDAGIMLPMFAVLVFPAWLARMAWIAWRQPARRRAQGVKLVVLVTAMIVAGVALTQREDARRAEAQRVVDAVAAWHDSHGAYPDTLDQVGFDARALRNDSRIFYFSDDGHATVFHAATFMPLDTWGWDFDKPGWQFHPD